MASSDVRDLMLKSIKGNPASNFEIKDWPREAIEEWPCNTHIRNWVREELLNRWRNFGMNYTDSGQATNYDSLDSPRALLAMQNTDEIPDWDKELYKGPKTSWVRVASNCEVPDENNPDKTMKGFVMLGNGNFHDTYGFDKGDGNNGGGGEAKTLLGYDQSTPPQRHEIEEPDYKHRPTPGVTSIDSEDFDGTRNFRRTSVKFTCWSPTQLDYMEKYFFQPAFSMSVEWGWNNYPRDALLPLDETGLAKRVQISNNERVESDIYQPGAASKHLRAGQGNYGFAIGLITGYNYSIREDGGYDCTVEMQCVSEIGRKVEDHSGKKQKVSQDANQTTFREFIHHTLGQLLLPAGTRQIGGSARKVDRASPKRNGVRAPERSDKELLAQAKREATRRSAYYKARGEQESSTITAQEEQAILLTRGRFFIFEPYASSKPYYAGKENMGGSYITVGLFIDLLNLFFARTTNTDAKICEFSCFNSRAIAHPNIKSTDGTVLLIPNSLAPRWNTKTFHADTGSHVFSGSTVGNAKTGLSESETYRLLKKGSDGNQRYSSTTSSFLNMITAQLGLTSPVTSIEDAMKKSPRDDLHRILAVNAQPGYNLQHPSIAGKQHAGLRETIVAGKPVDRLQSAYETTNETIRPFPDWKTFETSESSDGYSGRIADLFVNIQVIQNATVQHEGAEEILMSVMNQVSVAAGDIWDFNLIGGDTNTGSNTVLQLIDENFSGVTPVSTLKKKAWVFPVHRGDSIVRGMDITTDISSDVKSQVLFAGLGQQTEETTLTQNAFHSSTTATDMLIGGMSYTEGTKANPGTEKLISSPKEYPDMPDDKKKIVAMRANGLNTTTGVTAKPAYKTQDIFDNHYFKGKDNYHFIVDKGPGSEVNFNGRKGLSYRRPRGLSAESRQAGINEVITKEMYTFEDGTQRPLSHADIILKPGSLATFQSGDTGLKNFGDSTDGRAWNGLGERRYYKLYADEEFVTELKSITGNPSPLKKYDHVITESFVNDHETTDGWSVAQSDALFQKLVGFAFKWDDPDENDVRLKGGSGGRGKAIDPPEGEYIIESASIPRTSSGKHADVVKYDPAGIGDYIYPIVLVVKSTDKQLLNDAMIGRYHRAKKSGRPIPADIQSAIHENGISDEDITLQQRTRWINTDTNSPQLAIEQWRTNHGTTSPDVEVDIELVDPNTERMLDFCRNDSHTKNNMTNNKPLHGLELSITLDGIEGFRMCDVFNCSGVPTKFYDYGVFKINGVKHSISAGDWETTLNAQYWYHNALAEDVKLKKNRKHGKTQIDRKLKINSSATPLRTLL